MNQPNINTGMCTCALLCWENNGYTTTRATILNTCIVCKMSHIIPQKWHKHFLNGSTKKYY